MYTVYVEDSESKIRQPQMKRVIVDDVEDNEGKNVTVGTRRYRWCA